MARRIVSITSLRMTGRGPGRMASPSASSSASMSGSSRRCAVAGSAARSLRASFSSEAARVRRLRCRSSFAVASRSTMSSADSAPGVTAPETGMLPYGSKVRPEIRLEFDHNGERYRLYKAFCQKPAADLRADSGARWSDDAAEEQLREMLEFTPPGKGGAKPDHRGLQALFWVEQGSASGQPHINENAQTTLASALETEVGTVTGGERGRTLIKRIEARVSEIFTQKTRKPA